MPARALFVAVLRHVDDAKYRPRTDVAVYGTYMKQVGASVGQRSLGICVVISPITACHAIRDWSQANIDL